MQVSVVIPTYNSSSFLDRTLASVMRSAAGLSYEIIVVDDCSDDIGKLRALLKAYPDVHLVEKECKSNAAVSRNIGIGIAKGEFVFLLDSDDNFQSGYIKHRIEFMRFHKLDFSFGAYVNVWNDLRRQEVVELPQSDDAKDFLFIEDKDIRTSTISFLGIHKDKFRFNEELKKHQDWGFLIDTTSQSKLWKYDPFPGVELCCVRDGRMSGRMNLGASTYFIDHYLNKDTHISGFSKRHFALAALLKDKDSYLYFSNRIIADKLSIKFRIIKEAGDIFCKLNMFKLFAGLMRAYKYLSNIK